LGQLIIRKIATRCQILRLKCTKIDFGWGTRNKEDLLLREGEVREGRGDEKEDQGRHLEKSMVVRFG